MWNEFKISTTLQKLTDYPRLFNFVINRVNKSKRLQGVLIEALANVEQKKKLLRKLLLP